jgi:hypothetical protein
MPQTDERDVLIDLGVLDAEPAEAYHAKANRYLSSHQLLDFMACPWLYRKKQLGLLKDQDSPALLLGRATHCRILEGREAYESQFALGGPINKSTGKPFGKDTNAFRDWCKAQGKPGIHHDDLALIENMAAGVAMNDEAVDLLLHGRSEGVIRKNYCGTPCQARLDWVHPFRGIVDLKTTADLTWFENEVKRRRYHNQAAFYQSMLAEAIGNLVPFYLVAIEKAEPFRCGVWRISDNTLAIARQENEAAIRRLRRAWELDAFPTGYEEIRVLDVT